MRKEIIAMVLLAGWLAIGTELPMICSGGWERAAAPGGYLIRYDGKGWPKLNAKLPVTPGKFYRFLFESRGEGGPAFQIVVTRSGKRSHTGVSCDSRWTKHEFNVYAADAASLQFALVVDPGKSGVIEVRNVQWHELTDEDLRGNLLSDGDMENGNAVPADWNKIRESPEFVATIVENDNYLAGEKSMLFPLTPLKQGVWGMTSRYLPVEPGKRYLFSFWAKAEKSVLIRAGVSLWDPFGHVGKHFNEIGSFPLTPEWKKYEFSVTIPEDPAAYPDVSGRMVQLVWMCWDKNADTQVRLDDLRFEQMKREQ